MRLVAGGLVRLVEIAAAEVGGVELDAQPIGGELGEAGRAVVVVEEALARPGRSACRSCRRTRSLQLAPSRMSWR